jgi:hypothetical protein
MSTYYGREAFNAAKATGKSLSEAFDAMIVANAAYVATHSVSDVMERIVETEQYQATRRACSHHYDCDCDTIAMEAAGND